MREGDIVKHRIPTSLGYAEDEDIGIVVEVLNTARHAKSWPKILVLTNRGFEEWITQFCEVVNEKAD